MFFLAVTFVHVCAVFVLVFLTLKYSSPHTSTDLLLREALWKDFLVSLKTK